MSALARTATEPRIRINRPDDENEWFVKATTLEWTLPSPPAFHSYETLPRIN
jgi:hypothetical protein